MTTPPQELSIKALALGILLALLFTAANLYLGLQAGIVLSASIPAIILAMGCFKLSGHKTSVLENNIIQITASNGSMITAGVIFTVPAFIVLRVWNDFNFWQTFSISIFGGLFGVLFAIVLRRAMFQDPELPFPESRAIAEVLKLTGDKARTQEIVWGGLVAALVQLGQAGLRIISDNVQMWFLSTRTVIGFGAGFQPALLGAGYIIGFPAIISQSIGMIVGWFIGVPLLGLLFGLPHTSGDPLNVVMSIWDSEIRYIGVGALVVSGVWSLITLLPTLMKSLSMGAHLKGSKLQPDADRDLPIKMVVSCSILLLIPVAWFFYNNMDFTAMQFGHMAMVSFIAIAIIYTFIVGFLATVLSSYFAGLIGASGTPASALNFAVVIPIGFILLGFMIISGHSHHLVAASAAVLLVASIIATIITVSNNTMQVLYSGQEVGGSPWRQEIACLISVIACAAIIPPILNLLFNVYGMAGVLPHAGMDKSQMLMAPQAAMMSTLIDGIFSRQLPWNLISIGAVLAALAIAISSYLKRRYDLRFSVLMFSLGIYLPFNISSAMFLGGLMQLFVSRKHKKLQAQNKIDKNSLEEYRQRPILLASGFIAGGSVMGILLAIPFAIAHSTNVLVLAKDVGMVHILAETLGIVIAVAMCFGLYRVGRPKST